MNVPCGSCILLWPVQRGKLKHPRANRELRDTGGACERKHANAIGKLPNHRYLSLSLRNVLRRTVWQNESRTRIGCRRITWSPGEPGSPETTSLLKSWGCVDSPGDASQLQASYGAMGFCWRDSIHTHHGISAEPHQTHLPTPSCNLTTVETWKLP